VYRTEIKAKASFRVVDNSNMPIGNTDIRIQIYFSELVMKHSFVWVLCT